MPNVVGVAQECDPYSKILNLYKNAKVVILTSIKTGITQLDIDKFNKQYQK